MPHLSRLHVLEIEDRKDLTSTSIVNPVLKSLTEITDSLLI